MPIYHFHCADGSRDPDVDSTELADHQAARLMAVESAGEVLKMDSGKFLNPGM